MGLFKEVNKTTADDLYERSKEYLRQKNGLTHVICFNLEGKLGDAVASCETRVTMYVNQIIVGMQKDGYEILAVDVKFLPGKDFVAGVRQMYLLTVTYK